MAEVFISHAHTEEALARKVAVLLCDALGLRPSDFFLSSQEGRGVAPAASIRASIVNELRSVPALVVLITPKAAASPWVWLEAGNRLGSADKTAPLFLVPSARFVPLLAPVADMRCLQLDNDGELHELVQAVGKSLGKTPLDFLSYKSALEDLVQHSTHDYSLATERRGRRAAWLKRYAAVVMLTAAGLAALTYTVGLGRAAASKQASLERQHEAAMLQLNEELAKTASKYLKLRGTVLSAEGGVHGATVIVSQREVHDPTACQEPLCTKDITTSQGEFILDLTKIQANNDDRVVLTVVTPGFMPFSKALDVDVRATDQGTAPQVVRIAAVPPR